MNMKNAIIMCIIPNIVRTITAVLRTGQSQYVQGNVVFT